MRLRAFILGLVWAGLAAVIPMGLLVVDDMAHNEITNWEQVRRVVGGNALLGLAGYWRKRIALLKIPEEYRLALDLQREDQQK